MLKETFDHIGAVNAARNNIVHYGTKFDQGVPKFVTNERVAKLPDKAQWFPVSAKILDDLSADIDNINFRLQIVIERKKLGAHFGKAANWARQQPWRYRHAPEVGKSP